MRRATRARRREKPASPRARVSGEMRERRRAAGDVSSRRRVFVVSVGPNPPRRHEDAKNYDHFPGETRIVSFGISPSISGEYIASTSVAGIWKVPALFKRIVYSRAKDPFGTYS